MKTPTPRTDAAKFRVGDSNHFAVHVMHVEQLETELNEAHKEIEKLHKIIRDEYPEDQAEELIESCKKKK